MSTDKEQQEEELEVLKSIYDGDECFKQISPVVFQYKIGEDSDPKSFLLEISWGENYPTELPVINMDTFYNKHIVSIVKSNIVQKLKEQAEPMLGMGMTYTLFEYAKENVEELFANQPEVEPVVQSTRQDEENLSEQASGTGKVKERKEQLSKSQKRKIINRMDINGEMPRGWNWVDIVKHLSQSGRTAESGPP